MTPHYLPGGWSLKSKVGKDDGKQERTAELRIPLGAIQEGNVDQVVWRTTCDVAGAAPDSRRGR